MSSCCTTTVEKHRKARGALTVALAGNPNSGKSTLFNALTGLRQKVANYPGVTVEKKTGRCKLPDGKWIDVIDLPGTYSLISRSPDELIAMEILRGMRSDTAPPDVVVAVIDASNLQRNLYLVSQLVELGRPLVIALTMMDVAERRGLRVSAGELESALGVPVVPLVGHKRVGIAQLKERISEARVAPMPDWPLPEAMKEELTVVGGGLAILDSREGIPDPPQAPPGLAGYQAVAERLLIGDDADDLGPVKATEPVASLLKDSRGRLEQLGIDPMQADIEAHYNWIDGVAGRTVATADELAAMGNPGGSVLSYATPRRDTSEQIDAILVHKVWGLLIFAAVMGSLFVSIFWLAQPIMEGIQTAIAALGGWTVRNMAEGPLRALLTDGIFAGVGAVVVFVPQIAILFLFLSIMEDSGYLARAAFLMDRLLAKAGLPGKAFVPLLSSFACAIPGIMATRTIEDRKDRLAAILVAPFMSCSARLPVYTLLIAAFFVKWGPLGQAGVMLACYALGIVAAAVVAWIFRRTLLKGGRSAFIMELPSYKMPQAGQVARTVWVNTREFLVRAGTIIFCVSVVLWAMNYYPQLPPDRITAIKSSVHVDPSADAGTAAEQAVASEQLRHSFSGRIGHFLEPAIRPLGYDWKMGIGLLSAFAAREVFVSTMGVVYSAGDGEETTPLADAMTADRYPDGRPVWTPLVAVSLLVWFVLAMQCMSTLAVIKRETGGWGWAIFSLVYMNALAYVVSLLVYQGGRMLGFA